MMKLILKLVIKLMIKLIKKLMKVHNEVRVPVFILTDSNVSPKLTMNLPITCSSNSLFILGTVSSVTPNCIVYPTYTRGYTRWSQIKSPNPRLNIQQDDSLIILNSNKLTSEDVSLKKNLYLLGTRKWASGYFRGLRFDCSPSSALTYTVAAASC